MIWVTWRQHRNQMAATAGLVAATCVMLVLVGRGVHGTFADTGLARCLADASADCDALERAFDQRYSSMQFLIILLLTCPLAIGMFWGAPLVARELEHGTQRFAWTQGVSRRRWLGAKLALTGVVAAAAAGGLAAAASWFAHPFNEVFGVRVDYGVFDVQGVVPVAYTAFAFCLGVACGVLTRRVLPAMTLTLAGFIAVRAVVEFVVRPRLLPTETVSYPTLAGRPPTIREDLALTETVLTGTGEVFANGFDINIGPSTIGRWCPDLSTPGQLPAVDVLDSCLARLDLRTVETIRPASQYWTFQLLESAMFLGLAAALVVFSVVYVRRRLST